jgi:hypothetical protein
MARRIATDRKATAREVRAHAATLRELGERLGVAPVRLRDDGTVVVHSEEPGYGQVLRVSADASALVGTYVHVITDDVPGAVGTEEL